MMSEGMRCAKGAFGIFWKGVGPSEARIFRSKTPKKRIWGTNQEENFTFWGYLWGPMAQMEDCKWCLAFSAIGNPTWRSRFNGKFQNFTTFCPKKHVLTPFCHTWSLFLALILPYYAAQWCTEAVSHLFGPFRNQWHHLTGRQTS